MDEKQNCVCFSTVCLLSDLFAIFFVPCRYSLRFYNTDPCRSYTLNTNWINFRSCLLVCMSPISTLSHKIKRHPHYIDMFSSKFAMLDTHNTNRAAEYNKNYIIPVSLRDCVSILQTDIHFLPTQSNFYRHRPLSE